MDRLRFLSEFAYVVYHSIDPAEDHPYRISITGGDYKGFGGYGETLDEAIDGLLRALEVAPKPPEPKPGINPLTGVPDLIFTERKPQEEPPEWIKKMAAAFRKEGFGETLAQFILRETGGR